MSKTMNIEMLSKKTKSSSFSGVISIVENDKIMFQDCNGYADRANKRKINVDTRFAIASGTKMFTAIGIMKLIEAGKLKLEDDAFELIPKEFSKYDKNITIKHLLTHTSGLPDYFDEDAIQAGGDASLDIPNYELHKPSDYLKIMPNKEMKFNPGEDFNYNNSAFVLLAIIIERLTGDYHKYINEEVLLKANMKSSGFFEMNQLPTNTAYGYLELDENSNKTNIFDLPIIGGGDGGMFTTIKDMNLFWSFFMSGKIVNKNTVKKMITPHSHSQNLSYGLGVWLEKSEEGYNPFIFGQDPGVSFESGVNIEENRKHTVISNTESGAWVLSEIIQGS